MRLIKKFQIKTKSGGRTFYSPNKAQTHLSKNRTGRDYILKARQLGFTTDAQLLGLEKALTERDITVATLAHKRDRLEKIFQMSKFAWDNLDDDIKKLYGVQYDNVRELSFESTGSKLYVSLDLRGDTIHSLHISELNFMKDIGEKFAASLEAVPKGGSITIESTANGLNTGYDIWQDAVAGKNEFTPHFYNWTWDNDYWEKPPDNNKWKDDYKKLAKKYNLILNIQNDYQLSDEQLYWYYLKVRRLKERVKQEYPCILEGTLVDNGGFVSKIEECIINDFVKGVYYKGKKEAFKMETVKGYSVICTPEHLIKTQNRGFVPAQELTRDDRVLLLPLTFGNTLQRVVIELLPFLNISVDITEDFAEFVGIYMGDGDFYCKKRGLKYSSPTVGVTCGLQDEDLVETVKNHFRRFFGGYGVAGRGVKKNCVHIRKSDQFLREVFMGMSLIKQKRGGGYKREVGVPSYIFKSPERVVSAFLRGIFETDGFVDRDGNRIILFSKYLGFIEDIQLLLLSFGIMARINKVEKKSGDGKYTYIGYELILRKTANLIFRDKVGFLSKRKKDRLQQLDDNKHPNSLQNNIEYDNFSKLMPVGNRKVWDITTETSEFTANGVVVHNCIAEEAFLSSSISVFDLFKVSQLKSGNIIRVHKGVNIHHEPKEEHKYCIGVDTAEGVGNDSTAVEVWDITDNKEIIQVASFSDSSIRPDQTADLVIDLGNLYNDAFLIPERNSSGLSTVLKIQKEDYRNLFVNRQVDKKTQKAKNEYGWRTTGGNRDLMIDDFIELFENGNLVINSSKTIQEMKTFVRKNNGRREHDEGYHDDSLFASFLAIQGIKYYRDKKLQIVNKSRLGL